MKVMISYPPLPSDKGVPLLSQNRQFQWFKNPTYIYPMVPACAATMLKESGFDVIWDDGIAEGLTYDTWLSRVKSHSPDMIVIESKTPVIKRHWEIISDLRTEIPDTRIVLVGDHATALPQESMENCTVDFILTGGDYDFLLLNLCKVLSGTGQSLDLDPNKSRDLEPGIWYRENGHIRNTGTFTLTHDLNELPFIDRDLTGWRLYAYENGNFKYKPGTYVMAGRDCWWGRCTFCSWTTLYPGSRYRVVTVEKHLDEIGRLIEDHAVKEIFDDSGTFPKGRWLEDFCRGMMERGYHRNVVLGCNIRAGSMSEPQFRMMKKANFRFLLIGLESMNQKTLNRLRKGIKKEEIEYTCEMAKRAGLEPHLTTMVGYPWETREDAEETIDFAKKMFRKGILDSLQATIVIPYPGTPLFEEARTKGWLTSEDWSDYDMKEYVWKSPVSGAEVRYMTRRLYWSALSPKFLLRKLIHIRSLEDLGYTFTAGRKLFSHLADFRKTPPSLKERLHE
jgi:anaerobic magnesium-protoporphyrin IX monomethyl ester cyclase